MKPKIVSIRPYILSLVFILCELCSFSQKPPIDANAIENWESVMFPQISNDGKYALYKIGTSLFGKSTIVVMDTKGQWKIELPGVQGYPIFSSNSQAVFFKIGKDSLVIVETGTSSIRYISGVQSFLKSKTGNADWLVYQLGNPQKSLIVKNISTGKDRSIDFVQQYQLSDDGNTLLFLTQAKANPKTLSLHWYDIASGNMKIIWQGDKAENFLFDHSGKQLAFIVQTVSPNEQEKSFWYYKTGTDSAIELANNRSIENDSLKLDGLTYFSGDDNNLFISLKQKELPKPPSSPVDVWSYTDLKLQSVQVMELKPKTFTGVINLQQSRLIRLQREDEFVDLPSPMYDGPNNWALIKWKPGDVDASDIWSAQSFLPMFLVSIKNGKRIKVPGVDSQSGKLSPGEKYVVYYDDKQKKYFSYEIGSGTSRDIAKGIQTDWGGYFQDEPRSIHAGRGIAGWLKNDEGVLIYDHNDIWQIDMSGKKPPINVTNGYGKKHNIVFALSFDGYRDKLFSSDERLFINAFNTKTKENGFYRKKLSESGDPELLSRGSFVYDIPNNPFTSVGINFIPVKALHAEVYLLRRMKANEAPNVFVTTDFKTFTALSNVQPQKKFNWLTSELVSWKGLDGRPLQAILYKPENFDPHKKYPVIFSYHTRESDGLNQFLEPDILSAGMNINIPWYVSRGYLVFLPDIHYKIGEIGESVVNSVVSAAQYLSKMPWINAKKMGIQGGSIAGYETNYLVTHTNMFAAACTSASTSDEVSHYGSIVSSKGSIMKVPPDGVSMQNQVQYGQFCMGASLWERPDLYITNSPVFSAAQVTTPLLMMHATQDGSFDNALEFFTGLRRLGKKAWLLQYADGIHMIWDKSAEDFSIRMQQFFDHFLKDSAAPRWMMYGIPATKKGYDNGYELVKEKDAKTGKWVTPKESDLLTDEEKKKVETLKHRKPVTVTIE